MSRRSRSWRFDRGQQAQKPAGQLAHKRAQHAPMARIDHELSTPRTHRVAVRWPGGGKTK